MTSRRKRLLLGCGILVVAMAILLAALEWQRQRQGATMGADMLDGPGVPLSALEWEQRYTDPRTFVQLCEEVKARCESQKERFLQLSHLRTTRITRYDKRNEPVAISEALYRVHFQDGMERKEEIERQQLLGKPSFLDPDRAKINPEDTQISGPFTKEAPEGLYRYRLDGAEELRGTPALRIAFEPNTPAERTFRGIAWIDPETQEPLRMRGSLVKTPFGIDRFDLLLDYDVAENGHHQLRHVVMEVVGGFALVSLRYRIESELSDFREGK